MRTFLAGLWAAATVAPWPWQPNNNCRGIIRNETTLSNRLSNVQSLRPFMALWLSQAISLLGSQLVQFALVWWITSTTGSATLLARGTLAALLPQVLLGPVAGALVDRWDRKTVMIAADAVIALATLGLGLSFWLQRVTLATVYLVLFLRAAGAAFHWPALQASTTLMVPGKHLARAAGMNQALFGLASMIIPPLGALALVALPMQGILAIDVITAAAAMTFLAAIRVPRPPRDQLPVAGGLTSSVWAEMGQGLRFVLGWKGLLQFAIIGVVIHMLGQAAGSLTPLLVKQHFSGGAAEFGWLQSALGIGTLIGGILLGIWGGVRRRIPTSLSALVLDGLVIVAIALTPQEAFPLAVAGIFGMGCLEAIVVGLNGAAGQTVIPPEMQGRVFSLIASVTQLMAPLGLLLAGPIADVLGVRLWWVLTGITISLMGLVALFVPSIMHLEDGRPTAESGVG